METNDARSGGGSGRVLGDYRLNERLGESAETVTWLAEQRSVRRPAVVVELKTESLAGGREAFLADVRARAAVDHPLVASVYEAVTEPDACYAALEKLSGSSLGDRLRTREAMKPGQLAHVLRRTAEASLALEAAGMAAAPLGAADLFLDAHGVARLANVARAGTRESGRSAADISALGKELVPLVPDGVPGATRMLTLLAWMRGESLGRPLTWTEVRTYGEQIEQQLAEPVTAPIAPEIPSRSPMVAVMGVAGLLIAAGVAMIALKGNPATETTVLPEAVAVAAGRHPLPDGGEGDLSAFRIGAHEVTLGEYQQFLEALASLPPERRDDYDHASQPAEKSGHEPADWTAMKAALKSGQPWQGRVLTRDCPVVNVDWWDAAAFAEWRSGSLPSQDQWFAALRDQLPDPTSLRPSGWGPVTSLPPSDRTPPGLLGMAGSVAEWTTSQSVNPANPLGEKQWVICGGSFLAPGLGALSREFTDDRAQRRPDLGFRVVW